MFKAIRCLIGGSSFHLLMTIVVLKLLITTGVIVYYVLKTQKEDVVPEPVNQPPA